MVEWLHILSWRVIAMNNITLVDKLRYAITERNIVVDKYFSASTQEDRDKLGTLMQVINERIRLYENALSRYGIMLQ